MAYINQRLHEVQGWGGESESIPPQENVTFQVEEAEQKPSPNKGTPMLYLSCKVLAPEGIAGRKMRAQYVNSPDAKEASRRRLKQVIDATMVPLDGQGGFDDQELIGRAFVADIVSEPYEKDDPVMGTKVRKEGSKIVNERPYEQAQPTAGATGYAAGPPAAVGYPAQQQPPAGYGYGQPPQQQQAPAGYPQGAPGGFPPPGSPLPGYPPPSAPPAGYPAPGGYPPNVPAGYGQTAPAAAYAGAPPPAGYGVPNGAPPPRPTPPRPTPALSRV